MPSIDVAMARSLRGGFLDLVSASVRPAVEPRDAISNVKGQITDVKTAFSSWDNCMQASFCKWPVIAVIIVGSLILLSIVWCIARCLCCGLSCCCECCRCLKCCGECCGCCDPPRRSHKYLDEPYLPPSQGYKRQDPMTASPTLPRTAEPPQYAEFDSGRKAGGGEDSLPQMPSWEGANSRKVLMEEEEVELNQLNKPGANGANGMPMAPAAAAAAVGSNRGSPAPSADPRNPYGSPGIRPGREYMTAPGQRPVADPYAQAAAGQEYDYHSGYGQPSSPLGVDHLAMAGGAVAGGAGRRSPRAYNDGGLRQEQQQQQGYGRAYPPQRDAYDSRARASPYDEFPQPGGSPVYGAGRQSPAVGRQSPAVGRQSPAVGRQSPAVGPAAGAAGMQAAGYGAQERARRSPAPRGGQGYSRGGNYGGGGGNRGYPQYTTDPTRAPRPPPLRQYSVDMPTPGSPASTSPSLQNNSGFDFNSGYSRPQTSEGEAFNNNANRLPSPKPSPTPAPQQQAQPAAYPGYRAYQPPKN